MAGNGDRGDTITLTVTVSDGTNTDSVTSDGLTIADSRPTAQDDGQYAAQGGTTKRVSAPGVLANDKDADGDSLTVTAGSPIAGPYHGTLTLSSSGSFSYKPAPGVCNR